MSEIQFITNKRGRLLILYKIYDSNWQKEVALLC
jgi:hypothetical protein